MQYFAVLIILWTLVNSSLSWLLPHQAERPERRGNSRLSSVSQQMSQCQTLQECIQILKVLNQDRPAVSLMHDGINSIQIISMLEGKLGQDITSYQYFHTLVELFATSDGVHYADDEYRLQELWLIPNYFMLSLYEAMDLYTHFPRDTLKDKDIYPQTNEYLSLVIHDFDSSWFPIMASGMGDYIFFDLSNGEVFEYSPFEGGHKMEGMLQFENILQFVKHLVEMFDIGKYTVKSGVVEEVGKSETESVAEQIAESRFHLMNDNSNGGSQRKREAGLDEQEASGNAIETSQVPKHTRKLFNRHGIPLLHFNCSRMDMACDQLRNAVQLYGKPRGLCRTNDRLEIKANGKAACGEIKRIRGWDCNQYPFQALRMQDGSSAAIVPTKQLNLLGGQLSAFYRATGVSSRDRRKCFKLVSP